LIVNVTDLGFPSSSSSILKEAVMRARSVLLSLTVLAACGRVSDVTGPNAAAKKVSFSRFIAPPSSRSNLVVVTQGSTVPSPSGLRACYAGEGNATDVVSKQNGVVGVGVAFSAGRFGQAFDFSAVNEHVDVPASSVLDVGAGSGLTMSVWFYPRGRVFTLGDNIAGAGPLIEFDSGAQLWQHSQYGDDFGIFTNLATSSLDLNSHVIQVAPILAWNQWNQAAVTYDKASGMASLYVNRVLVARTFLGSYTPNTATALRIGGRVIGSFGAGAYTFNGAIDEVQLYDRALTDAEVAQLYDATGTMCVAPATQYVVQTFPPAGAESGVPFTTQPVVLLKDASGMVVSNSTAPVTVSIASGTGTLTGTTTVNAIAGVATFTNLGVAGAGTVTLKFTAGSLPVSTSSAATSAPITSVQVPRALAVIQQPTSGTSGLATTAWKIEVRDAANLKIANSTISIQAQISQGSGVISGTTTIAAVAGVATFSDLSIVGTGGFTLGFVATDPSYASAFAVSQPLSLSASQTVASMTLVTPPAGAITGAVFSSQPVLEIRDGAGQRVATATNIVTVSIASGSGTLNGNTTVTAVNGVVTFSGLSITGIGAVTLRFASAGIADIISPSFNIAPAASGLGVVTQAAGAETGVAFATQPVVQVIDAHGNRVTTFTGTVTASVLGGGTLLGTTTVAVNNGVAVFTNLERNVAGPMNLVFTTSGLTSATSASFTVVEIAVSVSPSQAKTGWKLDPAPVVEIRNGAGALMNISNATATVSIATGDGANLIGTLTVPIIAGRATFSDIKFAGLRGIYTLRFTYGSMSVVSGPITLEPKP
jgi:hypothetical protein